MNPPTYAIVLAEVTILVFPSEDLVILAESDQYGMSIAVKDIPHKIYDAYIHIILLL